MNTESALNGEERVHTKNLARKDIRTTKKVVVKCPTALRAFVLFTASIRYSSHTMHERWNTGTNKNMHLEKANIYKNCLPASNLLLSKKTGGLY
jgi:hypothetical protein